MKAGFRFQVSGFKFERRVARFSGIRFGNLKLGTRNPKRVHTGFTLIELIVVITVISTLAAVAMERLLYYQERAEKAVMDYTLEAVKMGLRIRMAELIIANRTAELPQLDRENPVTWLSEPPAGYAGEYVSPPKPGNWYFASKDHELVYVPNSRAYLDTGNADVKELRFRALLRYEPGAAAGAKTVVGVTVLPTREYKWF